MVKASLGSSGKCSAIGSSSFQLAIHLHNLRQFLQQAGEVLGLEMAHGQAHQQIPPADPEAVLRLAKARRGRSPPVDLERLEVELGRFGEIVGEKLPIGVFGEPLLVRQLGIGGRGVEAESRAALRRETPERPDCSVAGARGGGSSTAAGPPH